MDKKETTEAYLRVLSRIFDNLEACVFVSDIETFEILYVNKRMKEEYSLEDDATGATCWKGLRKKSGGQCDVCPKETLRLAPDEHYIWEEYIEESGKYFRNNDSLIEWIDGRQAHFHFSIDITEEKMGKIKLIEAKKMAEATSRLKSEFLSRMSHELRTPLNAIIGMTKIGASANNLEKAFECITRIENSARQLLLIINDILDMSRIESKRMIITDRLFNMDKAIRDIEEVMLEKAGEKHQDFQVHFDSNAKGFFYGDEKRISQIIINLLSNAIKFTPKGGEIGLHVDKLYTDAKMAFIGFRVTDTGIGIKSDAMKKLFTPFEQLDGGISRKYGGTGLGLAISKSIVEMMGGKFSVSSEPGKGSDFSFAIPLKTCDRSGNERQSMLNKGLTKDNVANNASNSYTENSFTAEIKNTQTAGVGEIKKAADYCSELSNSGRNTINTISYKKTVNKDSGNIIQTEQGGSYMSSGEILDSELKKYVDYEEALNRVRGNARIYKTLLNSFIKNTNLEKLKEELEKGDFKAASATAHVIKGVTANLSLKVAYDVIVTLESQLKNNYDASNTLQVFEEELKKTLECINIVLTKLE
ncbi:MAG: ATP-binding protein [Synergistaceae bacterium]|nr:ATP-binding protein [Synergistaceae bacterium]